MLISFKQHIQELNFTYNKKINITKMPDVWMSQINIEDKKFIVGIEYTNGIWEIQC